MRWSAGLEAFTATAELRSFRGAARRLEISPAAVSKAVARLEAELGVVLLERTSRRVAPTPAGIVFLEHARRALDALQAGVDRISAEREAPSGTLRISASPVLGAHLVAVLPRLLAPHPRLRVDLRLGDRQVDLIAEDVDLALRIGALPDSSLVAHRLPPLAWLTVASPAYLARRPAPRRPEDLDDHALLGFVRPAGGVSPWSFRVGDEVVRIRIEPAVRLDQGPLLVGAAEHGLGIAQVFEIQCREAVASGRLIPVLPGMVPAPVPLTALVSPARRSTPRVRAGLEAIDHAMRGQDDRRKS